jgi:coenzyme F420-reducing hydrogenase delta subunit
VVFGCGRSALPALEEARDAGLALPPRLAVVGVPCAGAVSSEHLLAAFARGAGGVLVLGCHDGNCHSETGTRHAGRRVEHLALRLPALGIDARRLRHATLAANMGAELVRLIGDFAAWLDDPARPGPTDASRDEVRA